MVEVGLVTSGDLQADTDRNVLTHAQSIHNVVEEAVLADEVGFDVFGIGEHHREDYAVSAPDMLLAAIAGLLCHRPLPPPPASSIFGNFFKFF